MKKMFRFRQKIIGIMCLAVFIIITSVYLFNHYNKSGITIGIDFSREKQGEICRTESGRYFDYSVCTDSNVEN